MPKLITRRQQKQGQLFTEDLGNEVELDMVLIPGGSFMMGTEDEEIERLVKEYEWDGYRREKPQHQLTVSDFFIGRYPITQDQWRKVAAWEPVERKLNSDPSHFTETFQEKSKTEVRWKRPVESISWDEAKEFCNRLSNRTKREYRLPTEAEWEYACRAGTTTPFHFGETISTELANYDGNRTYGRGSKGIHREQTTPVEFFSLANNFGLSLANNFGLSDMHGNVWEWCEDDWHETYENAPTNGIAWFSEESSNKVLRGGSWNHHPGFCRSAYRSHYTRDSRLNAFGFRVVCVAPRTT